MASNKTFRFGPIALTTALGTNLLSPPTAAGGVNAGTSAQYIVLKHIRITNKTASAAAFSTFLGATGANAAGTEIIGAGQQVAANNSYDWYGMLRIDAGEFLVGGSGTANALTISGEGEIGVAG